MDREGWGKSVVDRLAADIQINFPGIKGFSPGNLWRMRAFFLKYRTGAQILAQPARELLATNLSQAVTELNDSILPQAVSGIPWYHNVLIFEKLKVPVQRLWYATRTLEHGWMKSQPIVELTVSIQARRASEGWFRPLACASGLYFHQPTLEHGWSRAILTIQIESDLYGRQGKAISNFTNTLPSPQSDLVQHTLKDPYIFDFLTLHTEAIERDLESGLVDHIRKFLLEMGAGFAFVGQQMHIVGRFSARTAKKQLTKHRRDRSRIRASPNSLIRRRFNNSLGEKIETMNDMLIQDTSK